MYVNGNGYYLCIVDKNGKIYESSYGSANDKIENAKKIIATSYSRYIVKNDGTLWAKGHPNTGMWGDQERKDDYVQITKDGINTFTNVKNIYSSEVGESAIFTTDDNKMYWAGATNLIALPEIRGDYDSVGVGEITNYPKEVTSQVINEIRNKIKDIAYSFINDGGIRGCNTLILTKTESYIQLRVMKICQEIIQLQAINREILRN